MLRQCAPQWGPLSDGHRCVLSHEGLILSVDADHLGSNHNVDILGVCSYTRMQVRCRSSTQVTHLPYRSKPVEPMRYCWIAAPNLGAITLRTHGMSGHPRISATEWTTQASATRSKIDVSPCEADDARVGLCGRTCCGQDRSPVHVTGFSRSCPSRYSVVKDLCIPLYGEGAVRS